MVDTAEHSQHLSVAQVMGDIICAGETNLAGHMDDNLDWLEAIREGYTSDEIASMAADDFEVIDLNHS